MSEIEGVHVERLKLVRNERGHLLEVCGEIDPDAPRFAQVYVTFTRGGIVKAWYRHHHQIDQIALLSGRLELVLYDDRADSAAGGSLLRLELDESEPKIVRIPALVWHGFRAVGPAGTNLIHVNSEPYREDHLDEDRIAPDDPAIPYSW